MKCIGNLFQGIVWIYVNPVCVLTGSYNQVTFTSTIVLFPVGGSVNTSSFAFLSSPLLLHSLDRLLEERAKTDKTAQVFLLLAF